MKKFGEDPSAEPGQKTKNMRSDVLALGWSLKPLQQYYLSQKYN